MVDYSAVARAAHNNALWCDAVCRAHDCPGEFHDGLWLNRLGTPRYYPDAVTLVPEPSGQVEAISSLLHLPGTGECAVKDSFQRLDLTALGFELLFDAQWIGRDPSAPSAPRRSAELTWHRAIDAAELAAWEQAWAGEDPGARIFLPGLLPNPDLAFVSACRDGATFGGGILNRGAGAVGLSNLFFMSEQRELVWQGLADLAAVLFPGLPLVAYEGGDDLDAARRCGFTTIGPLCVWLRPAILG